ncbi:uncharacterized protein LOC129580667 [Paramacrobiotus metropolitanus]|uniref:uncharacterized protein LOC129580667 n=1 Tax=Paramacrobiotus metropolitanus TaxID=2943436 RepID=UPI0024457CF0|nr:uncharacterized protein LOC129580667 [Paramacrobiotus metropolitanus]
MEEPGIQAQVSGSHLPESTRNNSEPSATESMWTDNGPASNNDTLLLQSGVSTNEMVDDSEDSQPEPMSWQLGASFARPAGDNAAPKEQDSAAATKAEFKVPEPVPAKRRGRPPVSSKASEINASKSPAIKKPKPNRRNKSRRKRLTMSKAGRAANPAKKVPARPTAAPFNGQPVNRILTKEERKARLDHLFENCSEELSTDLRSATQTIEAICHEAAAFRENINTKGIQASSIETFQEELAVERKARQSQQDQEDINLTESLCEQTMQLQVAISTDTVIPPSALFIDGPPDGKIQEIRKILSLPPLEKSLGPVDMKILTDDFLQSVGLSADSRISLDSDTCVKADVKAETFQWTGSTGLVNRSHPKDLSQQLLGLLGKSVQPRMERRAAQRARRAAQSESVTEESMEKTCASYLTTMADLASVEIPSVSPKYHHVVRNENGQEAAISDFYDNFVKPCSCKGGSRCDLCRNLPAWKHRLPAATNVTVPANAMVYDHCMTCNMAYQLDFEFARILHPRHRYDAGEPLQLSKLSFWPEFLTGDEERDLTKCINARMWMDGGSGCRRQDYGPSVNYQRQRVNLQNFTGLPHFAQLLLGRFSRWKELDGFQCVAVSNWELTSDRMSSVQSRVEDEWMWGNRVVIFSILADTVLTFSPRKWERKEVYRPVRVQIPRRSLLIVTDEVRRDWNYSVLSADVHEKQIMMVFRELSDIFKEGGAREAVGKKMLSIAHTFQGKVVKSGGSL